MTSRHSLIARLFEQNHAWLCLRAGRLLNCRTRGEDIASETFLRLLRQPDLGLIREPRAFLTTIAKRVIVDSWRREELERELLQRLSSVPENTLPDPEEHAIMMETLFRLDQQLSGLSRNAKAAFVYSHFAGETYQQIAVRLGVSVGRIHQYMEQAYMHCLEVAIE